MRLLDLIQAECHLSATKAKRLIHAGEVFYKGQPLVDINQALDPDLMVIYYRSKRIGVGLGHHYLVYNKAAGQVSAKKDAHWPTPYDHLPECYQGTSIVGRLDRDVEGLLLLTDNGQLHYFLEHARFHMPKTYQVTVNGDLGADLVEKFQAGVTFADGTTCRPAKLEIIGPRQAYLTIDQGMRHQVKKMFLANGLKVVHLKRLSLGPLHLDPDLKTGRFRPLTGEESERIVRIMENNSRNHLITDRNSV
ncbi:MULTISPECIES: pseudouridine synthase [Aerococcus]|uniref:Pseudouridine synthase n=1 Tax=Aerococcus mictus TaxID=2976810 RepID=A0A9Q4DDM9_9LACT|nr:MULTISPECIES: pseudouridine synthase [Aerococcus]MCY3065942.1 pseudouridine synthase [Aerococcus mictus]MCY3069192.1 pseudouridine synthase [Aerococcus mictus]MCY3072793.1 pseudouridine synthase [Aerococcus mictus]MCY3078691.1 pseudouridine synthase [Aerococcus mictus]MCY3082119.1 pseudouridine synthase [Aerococcus mictus]